MTNPDTPWPTIIDDGRHVEIFATKHEAASAWNAVLSSVERQAAAFVSAIGPLASQGE